MKEFTKKEFNDFNREQFVKLGFNMIKSNPNKLFKSGSALYLYIWLKSNIVRYNWDDSKGFPLNQEFYVKQYLVCSFSIRQIAKLFEISEGAVKLAIKKMEDLRWIDIAKVKGKNKHNEQNVYILGEWERITVDGKERYIENFYADYRM